MQPHKTIEEISDYHNPQEVPGMTQQESWVRRFHDCLTSNWRDIEAKRMMSYMPLQYWRH